MGLGDREFDVVVYGATGFTGKLVSEHLARLYGDSTPTSELKWAIAGRTKKKLEKVREDIAQFVDRDVVDVPIIIANTNDESTLAEMCKRTSVVISTVGPFVRYGAPVVKACIQNGTDYVDSTGETSFILRMIAEHQDEAVRAGVRLVPSCGYDSIPSDLTTLCLKNSIEEQGENAQNLKVTHYIGPTRGGVSGGTLHTMATIFGAESTKMLKETYGTAYALVPKESRGAENGGDQRVPKERVGVWTSPFFMAAANERIVRRSAYLNGYGDEFSFTEVMACDGFFDALLKTFGISLAPLLFLFGPIRWLMTNYVLPDPGTGPSRRAMEKGYGTSYAHAKIGKQHYVVTCDIDADVGYLTTGKMLAESAIALARTKSESKIKKEKLGGFQTPASCYGLGNELIDLLQQNAGFTFTPKSLTSKEVTKLIKPFGAKKSKSKL